MAKNKEKHKWSYILFKYTLGVIFRLYYRPKLINKEVIPKDGPILVCGNHMHLFDQNLACLSTKRMLHYMAKIEYLRDKKVAWFFKAAGCIFVDREAHDGISTEKALAQLREGNAVGLFPEGTRNKTNEILLPFKFGAVSMAQKSDATIVPFAITGEYKFWNNHLNIRFGSPFKVPKDVNLEEANNKLFNEVKGLKEEGLEAIKKGEV